MNAIGKNFLIISLTPITKAGQQSLGRLSRDQFKEISRQWSTHCGRVLTDYKIKDRNTFQGRQTYFQSVYSDKVY
jgi:hypothetical protein